MNNTRPCKVFVKILYKILPAGFPKIKTKFTKTSLGNYFGPDLQLKSLFYLKKFLISLNYNKIL